MNRTAPSDVAISGDGAVDSSSQFLADLLAGLSTRPKRIPSKYFYDERGSRLFDQITELPEYYLTRTELWILRRHRDEIAECLGEGIVLIEYGSGSSTKTRLLLDRLKRITAYVPIDISGQHLRRIAIELARDYPHLTVVPVHADYTEPIDFPRLSGRKVVYFPGSTIGNFEPSEALDFFAGMRSIVGDDGAVLIGVDLKKDEDVLHAAYNDAAGVTAAFNLNVLRRANEELGADFDLGAFQHQAVFDSIKGRVEMRLVSRRDQEVRVDGAAYRFSKGEYIHTENSYKYEVGELADLASCAGFTMSRIWTDQNSWFAVALLTASFI